MALPLSTTVDSTYPNSGSDASVQQHQQDHDTIHAQVNGMPVPAVASKLFVVGDSYVTGGGATDADRQFVTLLAGMLRTDLVDLGVGGAQAGMDDMSAAGVLASVGYAGGGGWATTLQGYQPNRGGAPYTPAGIVPLVVFGHNDVTQHKPDASGSPRNIFKESLRTILSRLATSRIFEVDHSSFAYGGTGTWPALIRNSGGFPAHFNGSGAKRKPLPTSGTMTITWTVPADIEAGCYVGFLFTVPPGGDGSVAFTGTASPVASGGANFGLSKSMSGLAYAANGNTGTGTRDSANGVTVRIGPFVAADAGLTVVMTITGATTTAIATPAQPGVVTTVGTAGAVTYTYAWLEGNENGWSALGTTRSVTTGNATLSTTNYNTIPALGAFPTGVRWRALVRTVGGAAGVGAVVVAVLTTNVAVNDQSPYGLFGQPPDVARGLGVGRRGISFSGAQIEAVTPMAKGVVCNIPRKTTYTNGVTDTDIANYNSDVTSVAAEFGTAWTVADIDTVLGKTAANFASDGVHPNDRGHAKIAAYLYPLIQALSLGDQVAAAHQSQVMKRVSSRVLTTRRFGAGTDMRDYSVDTTTEHAIDATNLTLQINAEVGEDIEFGMSGAWGPEAQTAWLDFAILDASLAVVRYVCTRDEWSPTTFPGAGATPWVAPLQVAGFFPLSGTVTYTVRPNDLVTVNSIPGILIARVYGRSVSGTARTLYGGGAPTTGLLQVWAKNVGRRNNGYNTS